MYKEIKEIYDSFYDDKSKRIFINRFLNNLTGNRNYFINMIAENCKNVEGYNVEKYYRESSCEKKLIIYGAMISGKTRYDFHKYLGRDDIYCFCDKDVNKQKNGFLGKKVISPEELISEFKDYKVIIESKYYYDEIYKYLVENDFPKDNIILHSINGCQYFDYEYMEFNDSEVMVDAGCYDCETIKIFKDKVKRYNKIIALEPDKENYNNCIDIINKDKLENIQLINAGLWNEHKILHFCGGENSDSKISDSGEETCEVFALDDICKDEKVSFIKMDIEGSELNAIKGAEKTIILNKPKLAICVYHKNEDILDIQEYLMKLVPEYRFGIRHYTDFMYETVLYAFVPKKMMGEN